MLPRRVETIGDEHFEFIRHLKAERTLFNGTFRIHNRHLTTIVHLDEELAPLFSTRVQVRGIDECVLLAARKDGLPDLTCFAGTEGRSEQGFFNMAIMVLWFCREERSRCVIRLERSPWVIKTGDIPGSRFIRDFTFIMPAVGCSSIATFPNRDETSKAKARLVSYVAGSLTSFQFIEFHSTQAYLSWLHDCAADLRAADMSKIDLFTSKDDAVLALLSRFQALAADFPEDASYVAGWLGDPEKPAVEPLDPAGGTLGRLKHLSIITEDDFDAAEDMVAEADDAPRSSPFRDDTVHGELFLNSGSVSAPIAVASPRGRIRGATLSTIEEECSGLSGDVSDEDEE